MMPDADSPAPAVDADDEGVDVTLIRWALSLEPEARLAALQGFVDSIAAMTDAGPGS